MPDLPPGTLLIREPYVAGAELPREPRFVTTDGRRGSVARERLHGESRRGLRRHHTCLGKADGAWKVTAVVFVQPD